MLDRVQDQGLVPFDGLGELLAWGSHLPVPAAGLLAAAAIARCGGRYLVRGADPQVAEGDRRGAARVVIVEFPSMEQLQRWYASDEHAEALAVRSVALDRRLLFVDGVDNSSILD